MEKVNRNFQFLKKIEGFDKSEIDFTKKMLTHQNKYGIGKIKSEYLFEKIDANVHYNFQKKFFEKEIIVKYFICFEVFILKIFKEIDSKHKVEKMFDKEHKFNSINPVKNNIIKQGNSKTKIKINHKSSASYSNTPTNQTNFRSETAKKNANGQNNYENDKQAKNFYNSL